MRTTATCPKCSGKKLIVADLRDVQGQMRNHIGPIPAVAVRLSGVVVKVAGRFESWICAACGYTEFYAEDLGDVAQLAERWPEQVRIVDSTPPTKGPFR